MCEEPARKSERGCDPLNNMETDDVIKTNVKDRTVYAIDVNTEVD